MFLGQACNIFLRRKFVSLVLIFTLTAIVNSNLALGFEKINKSESHDKLVAFGKQLGAYLIALVEDPRISGGVNRQIMQWGTEPSDAVKEISIIILQEVFEFLVNNGARLKSSLSHLKKTQQLKPEEVQLLKALRGFDKKKLQKIHIRYKEGVQKIIQLVNSFFENMPEDAPHKMTPEQATTKLGMDMLIALLQLETE